MWKQLKDLKSKLKDAKAFCLRHQCLYGGLCGAHGWAAWATDKPEVYLPIMALYALLAWQG